MASRYHRSSRVPSTPTRLVGLPGRRDQPNAMSTPAVRRTKSLKNPDIYRSHESFGLSSIGNSSFSAASYASCSSPPSSSSSSSSTSSVSSGSCSDDDIDYDDTDEEVEREQSSEGIRAHHRIRPHARLSSTTVPASASVSSLNISIDPDDHSVEAYALRRRLLQRKFQRLQMKTQALRVRDIQLQARYADLKHQRSLLSSPPPPLDGAGYRHENGASNHSSIASSRTTPHLGLYRNCKLRRSHSMPSARQGLYPYRNHSKNAGSNRDRLNATVNTAATIGLKPDLILKDANPPLPPPPAHSSSFSSTVLEMKSLQAECELEATCKSQGKRKLFKLSKLKKLFKRGA